MIMLRTVLFKLLAYNRPTNINSSQQLDQSAGGADTGADHLRGIEQVRQLNSRHAGYVPEDGRGGGRVGAINCLGNTGCLHSNMAQKTGYHCQASCRKRHCICHIIWHHYCHPGGGTPGGSTQQVSAGWVTARGGRGCPHPLAVPGHMLEYPSTNPNQYGNDALF